MVTIFSTAEASCRFTYDVTELLISSAPAHVAERERPDKEDSEARWVLTQVKCRGCKQRQAGRSQGFHSLQGAWTLNQFRVIGVRLQKSQFELKHADKSVATV
jgi:hypothetical protein